MPLRRCGPLSHVIMNGSWVKKTVLCFWLVFYTQALHLGLLPVDLESMRPLPAWRAYGLPFLWVIGTLANSAMMSSIFASSPNFILLIGIYIISILLYSLSLWRTVNLRWKMCETTRSLLTYCEQHPLSPSSWRWLLVAAVLTATFGVFHLAWVIDTYTDPHFHLWNKNFWEAALYSVFFLLGWNYILFFALTLVPVVLLASLFADLRQNCVELLQTVSKNPNAKDSGMQSNEFSPEYVRFLWRSMRCQYQCLLDIFSATRNLLQWHLVYISFYSCLSSTTQLSDYINFYNSTTPRSLYQLAQILCQSVRFVMLCLACQKFQSESNEMRQSMLAYTSQLREFNRGNEVHMFAVQIKCQQNGILTVLWSFDINSVTALQMMSAIVSYTIVMRQSDIYFYEQ